MRKAYIESTRRGAFGSTSVRIKPLTKRQDDSQPGPAHYQVKDRPTFSRYSGNVTANFASQSNRVHSPPPVVKVIITFITKHFILLWEGMFPYNAHQHFYAEMLKYWYVFYTHANIFPCITCLLYFLILCNIKYTAKSSIFEMRSILNFVWFQVFSDINTWKLYGTLFINLTLQSLHAWVEKLCLYVAVRSHGNHFTIGIVQIIPMSHVIAMCKVERNPSPSCICNWFVTVCPAFISSVMC